MRVSFSCKEVSSLYYFGMFGSSHHDFYSPSRVNLFLKDSKSFCSYIRDPIPPKGVLNFLIFALENHDTRNDQGREMKE